VSSSDPVPFYKSPKLIFAGVALAVVSALLVGCYITDVTWADVTKLIISSYMSSAA
jgi:hypothetical protein